LFSVNNFHFVGSLPVSERLGLVNRFRVLRIDNLLGRNSYFGFQDLIIKWNEISILGFED
jgi:hypothetical protein